MRKDDLPFGGVLTFVDRHTHTDQSIYSHNYVDMIYIGIHTTFTQACIYTYKKIFNIHMHICMCNIFVYLFTYLPTHVSIDVSIDSCTSLPGRSHSKILALHMLCSAVGSCLSG